MVVVVRLSVERACDCSRFSPSPTTSVMADCNKLAVVETAYFLRNSRLTPVQRPDPELRYPRRQLHEEARVDSRREVVSADSGPDQEQPPRSQRRGAGQP